MCQSDTFEMGRMGWLRDEFQLKNAKLQHDNPLHIVEGQPVGLLFYYSTKLHSHFQILRGLQSQLTIKANPFIVSILVLAYHYV